MIRTQVRPHSKRLIFPYNGFVQHVFTFRRHTEQLISGRRQTYVFPPPPRNDATAVVDAKRYTYHAHRVTATHVKQRPWLRAKRVQSQSWWSIANYRAE
jgi:hypothetical protein